MDEIGDGMLDHAQTLVGKMPPEADDDTSHLAEGFKRSMVKSAFVLGLRTM